MSERKSPWRIWGPILIIVAIIILGIAFARNNDSWDMNRYNDSVTGDENNTVSQETADIDAQLQILASDLENTDAALNDEQIQ